jgi:site-specific DNA recombinase
MVFHLASARTRADARARLVVAPSRGRRRLEELLSGTVKSVEEIAKREGCSARKVNMTISLAFLAPGLVNAAIEGQLPRGVGIARLCELPVSWSEQYQRLGIAQPQPH